MVCEIDKLTNFVIKTYYFNNIVLKIIKLHEVRSESDFTGRTILDDRSAGKMSGFK